MDEKAKEIIAPFSDWEIGGLRFGRVMSAIDAIVESKFEKYKNELTAKIQKLQIESTFPPDTKEDEEVRKQIEKEIDLEICGEADEDEEEKLEESKNSEFEFKRSIEELLIKKFESELNTLIDAEYYNNVPWFVNLPSYTTKTNTVSSSINDYCRELKNKVDTLINSIEIDINSNAFYITRRKVDTNIIVPTMLLFDPKTCSVSRASPFGFNDEIKLIITDCNGDKHIIKSNYHRGYAIIDCDNGNPNFMLFDPVNCECVLFYKSHKLLNASCDARNIKNDKDVDEEVNNEKPCEKYKTQLSSLYGVAMTPEVKEDKRIKTRNELKRKYGNAIGNAIASVTNEEEDKRIKTRNTLKSLFGEVIMTITNEREVNENFTYSNSDLQTLKKNIRKYIRTLICKISESEPLYIYSNRNKNIEKPLTCYHTRSYSIIPDVTNKNSFVINVDCLNYDINIPINSFSKSTYFLSVRNTDFENKSYNFAIVNTRTKEFVIFTKDKYIFDGWKLEITAER